MEMSWKERMTQAQGPRTLKFCGLCDQKIQSVAELERHRKTAHHIKMLKKFNIPLDTGLEDFILYYFSQPKGEIPLHELHHFTKDPRFWCTVCCTPSQTVGDFRAHNGGKKHRDRLTVLGLPTIHSDFDHYEEYMMISFFSSEVGSTSNPLKYEDPLVALSTIESFRAKGISIPLCVRRVLKVKRQCKLSEEDKFNYDLDTAVKCLSQVHYSTVLVEGDDIIGIIAFDDISSEECTLIEEISKGIYFCGGKVQRSKKKKAGWTVMCGWRRDMGKHKGDVDEFGRYCVHFNMLFSFSFCIYVYIF